MLRKIAQYNYNLRIFSQAKLMRFIEINFSPNLSFWIKNPLRSQKFLAMMFLSSILSPLNK